MVLAPPIGKNCHGKWEGPNKSPCSYDFSSRAETTWLNSSLVPNRLSPEGVRRLKRAGRHSASFTPAWLNENLPGSCMCGRSHSRMCVYFWWNGFGVQGKLGLLSRSECSCHEFKFDIKDWKWSLTPKMQTAEGCWGIFNWVRWKRLNVSGIVTAPAQGPCVWVC